MKITRRKFLKLSGAAAAGTVFMGGLGFDLSPAEAYARDLRIKGAKETTTICCYCSVGCGILVQTKEGKVINAEGDPEHPVSEGSLCSKGASLYQTVNNESRLRKPRYRAPGSAAWKEVEWDWALDQIARRIKDTRDRTFKSTTRTKILEKTAAVVPDASGRFPEILTEVERDVVVNRTDGIAHVGSAALDNEECYLIQKLVRSWGVVHVEHQARL
jgi:formate dehydrogenase major subunit